LVDGVQLELLQQLQRSEEVHDCMQHKQSRLLQYERTLSARQ
jgi:hypothetical protein